MPAVHFARTLVLALVIGVPLAAGAASVPTYSTVYSFMSTPTDGYHPTGELVESNGIFYGTTSSGGGEGSPGVVFALDSNTGAESVLFSFAGLAQGAVPTGVIEYGGSLYGTTAHGGTSALGTAYKIDLATGIETTLHQFMGGGSDGATPAAAMTYCSGSLYGTAYQGGGGDAGMIFRIDPGTDAFAPVYSFDYKQDGAYPASKMLCYRGNLYGTTSFGGRFGLGTVFRYSLADSKMQVLHNFAGGTDGSSPLGGLVESGGMLYGTTSGDGAGAGTLFKIDLAARTETVLHEFGVTGKGSIADGGFPQAKLMAVNGRLYGTTLSGGSHNYGTVFMYDIASGTESVIHNFSGDTAGDSPSGGLTFYNGAFYGTTFNGGSNYAGMVYKLAP